MEDGGLDRLLKELPRVAASPGFTGRVLSRLDEEAPARRRTLALWPRLALPAAALAAALGAVVITQEVRTQRVKSEAAEARALLEEIRSEHSRLEDDLRALDRLAAEPVLYLGGDDELDLVVDLERVEGAVAPARTAAPRL